MAAAVRDLPSPVSVLVCARCGAVVGERLKDGRVVVRRKRFRAVWAAGARGTVTCPVDHCGAVAVVET